MTNTGLLKQIIAESGLKIGYIAKRLNMCRQALWRRINNMIPFNQFEIEDMCMILQISPAVREQIFFSKNVDK